MTSRQEQFSGTRDVLEAHQFDPEPLQEYMFSYVEGFHGPLTVRQFRGGQSCYYLLLNLRVLPPSNVVTPPFVAL